ncbi:putative tricarboxylic transport membrane protein [Chromohalobacter marismortui]|uniref:Putative tricarboxylic transport membrane protein n=1 Tax=Chromohalobacter marismortui TaxID=42055 RepID=A0A4R7NSC9_9GAMM|nr:MULTISPECIES: tripartite tricarboxylate transporter permease [Chromohalobacter]MCI0509290.1 tripartite tricarboxylate transporter permease [Chromohalobacter sp.]MCI0593838.1 tripartite tricarboxylate transporter permease [Chromohalobacter sp.]TDU23817.1 putative tricarboxylic transport membrane protein [Chromohalobacter marismortui]
MTEALFAGMDQLFTLPTMATMLLGVVAGVIASAIPGFTITMAIVLTLPLTFTMDPLQGVATMLAVYVGGYSGGLISAALLGIPGTPSSVATTFDAFPMARSGQPGRALALGIWASFFGALVSAIILIIAAPPLAMIAVKLGAWEYFSLIIFAMTVVASLVGKSMLKGLMTGMLGLFIATVGADPMMGVARFTFDFDLLANGFPFLVVLIGIFAVSQLLQEVEDAEQTQHGKQLIPANVAFKPLDALRETLTYPINLIRSSLVGVFIGAVPGAGGSIANLLAYDQAKRASKTPETFGTGTPEGVIASESGNSATSGGGLIPMIALGIPGSAVDAVLMASLMVHGIGIGPRLILDHGDLVYGMFMAMLLAAFMVLVVCLFSMRLFLRVTDVPRSVIVPVVLVCCVVGAFALNNRITDIYLLLGVGIFGYILSKLDYPLAPLVLGVILGPIAETNLRRALMTDEDWTLFFTRPISLTLLILAAVSVAFAIRHRLRQRRSEQTA